MLDTGQSGRRIVTTLEGKSGRRRQLTLGSVVVSEKLWLKHAKNADLMPIVFAQSMADVRLKMYGNNGYCLGQHAHGDHDGDDDDDDSNKADDGYGHGHGHGHGHDDDYHDDDDDDVDDADNDNDGHDDDDDDDDGEIV